MQLRTMEAIIKANERKQEYIQQATALSTADGSESHGSLPAPSLPRLGPSGRYRTAGLQARM